jgi:hypothetical protein
MMHDECDKEALSLCAFGALAGLEQELVERHVSWCTACSVELSTFEDVISMLGELPPEALLSGPPEGGELLLQRTLRTMRAELSGTRRRRAAWGTVVAAGVVAAAVAGGVAIGLNAGPQTDPVVQATRGPAVPAPVPGTREGSATDEGTSAVLAVELVPAAGWVHVKVSVRGIPAGENCRVIVVSRTGSREVAGGWIASEKGKRDGTVLDGAAAIAPDDVVAIEIENTSGKRYVHLKI